MATGDKLVTFDMAKAMNDDLNGKNADLKSAFALQQENIPDTVQTIAFTFADTTITEVRTLNTGEKLTIVTNTETLQTTVTYAAA